MKEDGSGDFLELGLGDLKFLLIKRTVLHFARLRSKTLSRKRYILKPLAGKKNARQ